MYGQNNIVGLPTAGVGATSMGGALYYGWTYLAVVATILLIFGATGMLRDHIRRQGRRP